MSQQPEHHTTIIKEDSGGSGWFIATILLILLALGVWYAYHRMQKPAPDTSDINIQVDLPEGLTPDSNQE